LGANCLCDCVIVRRGVSVVASSGILKV
jgi:hypothetical protein